jgi:hypothetical protein
MSLIRDLDNKDSPVTRWFARPGRRSSRTGPPINSPLDTLGADASLDDQLALPPLSMERLWKNEGATGRKWLARQRPLKRMNKPNRSPLVATDRRQDLMVRRGSTVESVRGLCKSAAKRRFLFRENLHNL